MRFVSKNANLMVVLKPGLPGSHLTGQAPVTGIYAKFQNGILEVKDEEMIIKMKAHPSFNQDFIAIEEKEIDPFANTRSDIEPVHNIKEIQFGHIVGGQQTKTPVKISPELQKFIEEQATSMAKAMLPSMMKEVLTQMKNTPTDAQGDTELPVADETELEAEEVVPEESETNVTIETPIKNKKGKGKKA